MSLLSLGELTGGERIAATFLAFRMLDEAHRRGSNPPFGLWAAEFAGSPMARVGTAAADLAKELWDREHRE